MSYKDKTAHMYLFCHTKTAHMYSFCCVLLSPFLFNLFSISWFSQNFLPKKNSSWLRYSFSIDHTNYIMLPVKLYRIRFKIFSVRFVYKLKICRPKLIILTPRNCDSLWGLQKNVFPHFLILMFANLFVAQGIVSLVACTYVHFV